MLKTSFSKYLTAFIIISLLSFIILTAIITSMVSNYAFSDTEQRLEKESSIVVQVIQSDGVHSIEEEIYELADAIEPMVKLNSDFDVMVIDSNGKIILSTAHSASDDTKTPVINLEEGMGRINISYFEERIGTDGEKSYVYNGKIGNSSEQYMAFAKPVEINGEISCYV